MEPEIDPDKHRPRIEGLVGKPSVMTLKDLEALKDKEEFVTLQCIGNPVGGDAIGNALWEGVTLRKILDLARPGPGIVKAAFFLRGRVQRQHPLQAGALGRCIPGAHLNGEPLPRQHGYPLRLIVPGIYGMKNVKWLSKIELEQY